ncbi:unnamed protein product [Leptosia nina]|uniref:Exophilin 5 n=1 Tax=Leptosia nina TaxID=320188 RepID=A0AAV1J5M0_9NEOP
MGSNISKTDAATNEKSEVLNKDVSGHPDPRSPTPEITRTPLQNKPGSKHNITKNVDLRKALENNKGEDKLVHINPILSAVIKNHLQSFDPRSPTQEFERTPIIISSREEKCKGVQNILLDSCSSPNLPNDTFQNIKDKDSYTSPEIIPKNLCYDFNDMSLSESLKEEEPLGSSTASKEAIEKNISSNSLTPTVLLETNFDFIENDKVKELQLSALNPVLKHAPVFKILDCDPRSPSVGIDRTPIVVQKKDELSSEDKAEQVPEYIPIKHLQNDNSGMKTTIGDNKSSDGILIYEDDSNSLNVTPKKSKSASNSGSRTPLSCVKNKTENHGRSKSTNTLFDSKKHKTVTQKSKRVSHIPRLIQTKQTKCIPISSSVSLKNAAINGDYENTPPNSHRDNWDKEGSIVL